ncbi:MAG: hypothetical protein ACRDHE_01535 [Ktedonobacterales bacterium]
MTTHEREFNEEETTLPEEPINLAEPDTISPTSNSGAHKARARRQTPRNAARRLSDERAIVQLPASDHALRAADETDGDASALHDLEAQGFTEDEAVRLIHVSDRLKTSREAREAEAVLRRLRFTRWLIQQGVLDEFSA